MRKVWMLVVLMAAMGLVAGCQKNQGQAQRPPDQKQPEETAKAPSDSMKPEEKEGAAPQEGEKPSDQMKPEDEGRKPSEAAPKEGQADSPTPPERTAQEGQPKEAIGPENMRRMDNQFEREFTRKVRADSQLSEYEVKADVKNGELTITGAVPNEELKTKAGELAKTVTGLKGVRNDLATTAQMKEMGKITDDDLKNELKDKIDADQELRESSVEVTVKDAKATVTGTVPSEELKKKIATLAQTVHGLAGVDNQVKVQEARGAAAPGQSQPKVAAEPAPNEPKGAEQQPMERREGQPEEPRSDRGMAMELRTKILSDSQLNDYDIDVDVTNGLAMLTGAVPNEEMKRKAERLAKTVAGLREIRNDIKVVEGPVPPAEKRSDTGIKAELKAKLLADSELSGWKTKLDVNNGIVTMSGNVDKEQLKKKASTLAETVAGVEEIRNDIQVQPGTREQTSADDTGSVEMDTIAKAKKPETDRESMEPGAETSDSAIAKQIEGKYITEPQLKGSDIQVQMKKGTATLTGTVWSEEQRQMAERIARQTEGVREVKNKLEVKPETR